MMKNILIVCRTNSMMSPIVEALINSRSNGTWQAFSAGSQPASRFNPYTFAVLKEAGIIVDSGHSPTNWRDFSGAHAPRFEIVLTVSEDVAWEDMPLWNGVPRLLHWALPDPLAMHCSACERMGLVSAWRDLARARVDAFLTEEGHAPRPGRSANDNRGDFVRDFGT
jgi:arsenate reductase